MKPPQRPKGTAWTILLAGVGVSVLAYVASTQIAPAVAWGLAPTGMGLAVLAGWGFVAELGRARQAELQARGLRNGPTPPQVPQIARLAAFFCATGLCSALQQPRVKNHHWTIDWYVGLIAMAVVLWVVIVLGAAYYDLHCARRLAAVAWPDGSNAATRPS